jgi:hypothetical protein
VELDGRYEIRVSRAALKRWLALAKKRGVNFAAVLRELAEGWAK